MDKLQKLAGFLPMAFLVGLLALPGCQFLKLLNIAPPEELEKQALEDFPAKCEHRLGPYLFIADFPIDRNLPLFQELAGLRNQVYRELKLPPSEKMIYVYLFENRRRYEEFMGIHYPNLPKRRAFFVAQPRPIGGTEDLMVFTYWGDKIKQDLRHELTHALLHSVLLDVPLWLDEGLAEYFETPKNWRGVNYKHLKQIRLAANAPFQPNMERLESLTEVDQMSPSEYRESWGWVHFMLRGNPNARQVLLSYLHELQTNKQPAPLHQRLRGVVPDLDGAFANHLNRLESAPAPGVASFQ